MFYSITISDLTWPEIAAPIFMNISDRTLATGGKLMIYFEITFPISLIAEYIFHFIRYVSNWMLNDQQRSYYPGGEGWGSVGVIRCGVGSWEVQMLEVSRDYWWNVALA